jgi:hypothetical protein
MKFFRNNKKRFTTRKSKTNLGSSNHSGRDSAIEYYQEVQQLKETIPNWDNLFGFKVDPESRSNDWVRIDVLGEPLTKKFAWSIPDEQALKILMNFCPLIEIGAGKGMHIK